MSHFKQGRQSMRQRVEVTWHCLQLRDPQVYISALWEVDKFFDKWCSTRVIKQMNIMMSISDNSFWINYTLYLISWRTTVQESRSGPRFRNSVVTASMCVSHWDLSCRLSCHVVCRCTSWSNITADGPGAMIVRIARPCWWGPIVVDVVIVERLHRALLVEGISVSWGLLPMRSAGIRQKVCLRRRRRFKKIETCWVIWCGGVGEGLLLLFYEASNWVLMLKLGTTTWCS